MKLSDEDILSVLMKARERISASVWLILKDTQISEDIFQNITLKALTKDASFNSEGHLLSWSFVSAKREAIDWLRKHKRENTGLDEEVLNILENDWLTRAQSKNNQHIETLRDCIESVPENSRQLLKLRYFDGHSCGEVGKLIGLGLDAVYKRLSRLHKNIKKCMECKLEKNSGAS